MATIQTESNRHALAFDNFHRHKTHLERAIDLGLLRQPHFREPLAIGGLAKGWLGIDKPDIAEHHFRRYFEAAKAINLDPGVHEELFGACLAVQKKYDEAETMLMNCIARREEKHGPRDTTSFR